LQVGRIASADSIGFKSSRALANQENDRKDDSVNANGANPFVRTQRINQATTASATMNETTNPIASTTHWCG